MNLHVPTVFLAVVVITTTLSMTTVLSISRYRGEGVAFWFMAFLFVSIAGGLFYYRGVISNMLSIVVANGLVAAIMALMAEGLFQFQKRKPPRLLIWLPVLLMPLAFMFLMDDFRLRNIIASAMFSLQCLFLCLVVLRSRREASGRGAYVAAAGLAVLAGIFGFRLVATVLDPNPIQRVVVLDAANVSGAFLGVACLLMVSHGLLVMIKARADESIRVLATRDALTGLANRRRLDEILATEWARARRGGSSLALVMFDVDFFKKFNDTYGHQAGDRCLTAIARILETASRRVEDLAARYGGEEFILVLPGAGSLAAGALAEEVRRSVEALAVGNSQSPAGKVTVSAGVATTENGGCETLEDLLNQVDKALYLAKANGRNQVQMATASPSMVPVSRLGTSSSTGRIIA
jgi:diguanylate cyclase (GGDEF)-like protein